MISKLRKNGWLDTQVFSIHEGVKEIRNCLINLDDVRMFKQQGEITRVTFKDDTFSELPVALDDITKFLGDMY
jgi:hypothetical protein